MGWEMFVMNLLEKDLRNDGYLTEKNKTRKIHILCNSKEGCSTGVIEERNFRISSRNEVNLSVGSFLKSSIGSSMEEIFLMALTTPWIFLIEVDSGGNVSEGNARWRNIL